LLLLVTLLSGDRALIASAQVAYWSSTLVVLASFRSYRRMVQQRLEAGMIPDTGADRDLIDRIEDPHDLYTDTASAPEDEAKPVRELIREEKQRIKAQRRSPLQSARDAVPAFSFWRLGAYGVLAVGFFFLQSRHWLHLGAYLIALALPVVLAVWSLMRQEGRHV
jgi:hypothetical protein